MLLHDLKGDVIQTSARCCVQVCDGPVLRHLVQDKKLELLVAGLLHHKVNRE